MTNVQTSDHTLPVRCITLRKAVVCIDNHPTPGYVLFCTGCRHSFLSGDRIGQMHVCDLSRVRTRDAQDTLARNLIHSIKSSTNNSYDRKRNERGRFCKDNKAQEPFECGPVDPVLPEGVLQELKRSSDADRVQKLHQYARRCNPSTEYRRASQRTERAISNCIKKDTLMWSTHSLLLNLS